MEDERNNFHVRIAIIDGRTSSLESPLTALEKEVANLEADNAAYNSLAIVRVY